MTPARTGSGASRSYTARDRARLVLALRGKRFGMSLAEIREIVDMYDAEPGETARYAGSWSPSRSCVPTSSCGSPSSPGPWPRSTTCRADATPGSGELEAAAASPTSRSRTSPPTRVRGSRSGRVADGAVARGASAPTKGTPTPPASGAKSR